MWASALRLSTACVLALVMATACRIGTDKAGGRQPKHVLTLRVLNTRGEEEIAPFVDRLTSLSGGSITLDVANKWKRQDPAADIDAIRAMQANQADLAVIPVRAWHEVGVTSFDALIAPFAIDSLTAEEKVLTSDLPDQMLPAVGQVGLKGIGILPGPLIQPTGITKVFTKPADFNGARIGYSRSVVAQKTLQALGATPVTRAFEGTSIAGFDGVELQTTAVPQYVHLLRSVTANVALWPRPNVLVMTPRTYAKLTEQQRGWLRSAVHDAIAPTVQALRNIHEDLGILCRNAQFRFVTASIDDLSALHTAVRPVLGWLRQNAATARYLNEIAEQRKRVTPEPDDRPSCAGFPAASTAPTAPTPFDGTYRMVTPADCDPAPENCGTWTFHLDRGRFAITQENGPACTWGYGTYEVTGDRIEWLFTDGGGVAPSGAQNKPGEDFVFTWSRYRGQVTLSAVPGAISPKNFFLRPWRRLSTHPNASYLSKRCPPPASALPG